MKDSGWAMSKGDTICFKEGEFEAQKEEGGRWSFELHLSSYC